MERALSGRVPRFRATVPTPGNSARRKTKERTMPDAKQSPELTRKYAAFPHSFRDPWEDVDVEMSFRFAKPTKTEIKRLQDTASKNPTQASRNLLLSTVHPEDKDKLTQAMDEYPGIATSYSTALIRAVGISADLGN